MMFRSVSVISTALCFLIYSNAICQTPSVTGKVCSGANAISAASVTLLNSSDSSWVQSVLSGDTGAYAISFAQNGKYIILASALGYSTASKTIEVVNNTPITCNLSLLKENTTLTEVAVTAKKPFIEMSLGKIVVNIEGTTTTAASNVLDLMRRLPGITVDPHGGISMRGKEGVLVLIDDRPTYLSGDELADYLRTISANETTQMELVTQPGAKYDATGNTGIINVKLKKNKRPGWSGNLSVTYGQGVYFNRHENLSLNYKKNKLSLSLNANDMEAIGFADWQEQLYYVDIQTGLAAGSRNIHSAPKERFANTAARLTADYDLTESLKTGISLRGTYHPNVMKGYLFAVNSDASNTNSYNSIISNDGHYREDLMSNAYFSKKFNKDNSIDLNMDYLTFKKKTWQDITNSYYDSNMQPLAVDDIQNIRQPSSINVYSIKADYNGILSNGINLDCGIKLSSAGTDYISDVRLLKNNSWSTDTGRSNHFGYTETISAAYINAGKSIGKKWETRFGLRAEHTIADGLQHVGNVSFHKQYLSLFPTAFLKYNANKDNQWELNYGRRIERPAYNQLNPFIYYSFQGNYNVGNPDLMPMYTNNAELKHSYKNLLITTISASKSDNPITSLIELRNPVNLTYFTTKNMGTNSNLVLSTIFNKEVRKWVTVNASGSICYYDFDGIYKGGYRKVTWVGYSVDLSCQLDFGNGWKAEIYGNYVSAGRWSLVSSFDPNYNLDAGVSKKINDHFTVRFFASDPFYIRCYISHDNQPNYRMDTRNRWGTRLFSFSVSYNFGGKQSSTRNVSDIEEAGRVR